MSYIHWSFSQPMGNWSSQQGQSIHLKEKIITQVRRRDRCSFLVPSPSVCKFVSQNGGRCRFTTWLETTVGAEQCINQINDVQRSKPAGWQGETRVCFVMFKVCDPQIEKQISLHLNQRKKKKEALITIVDYVNIIVLETKLLISRQSRNETTLSFWLSFVSGHLVKKKKGTIFSLFKLCNWSLPTPEGNVLNNLLCWVAKCHLVLNR